MSDRKPESPQKRFSLLLSIFVHNVKLALSAFVNDRNAFLALVSVVAVLKLVYSAIAPASFDLGEIASFRAYQVPVGPWIFLYPPLYLPWASNATLVHAWVAAPPTLSSNFMVLSVLFRLPILALDIATMIPLYYIGKRLSSSTNGKLASLIWFLNPYSLFAIEYLGVPDVVVTFLTLVAFYMLISRRPLLSGVFLGFGIWIKFYPILLLPAFLLFASAYGGSRKHNAAILCFGLIGLVGYLAWVFPPQFVLESLATYTPVTQLVPFIGDSGSWFNGPSLIMILFYCLLGLFAKRAKTALGTLLLTLLVYYAFSVTNPYPNPYPQELVWAMPFMALDIALVNRSRALIYALTYALAFSQWFFVFLVPYRGPISSYSFLHIVTQLALPLVSSALFACILVYAAEIVRPWFGSSK